MVMGFTEEEMHGLDRAKFVKLELEGEPLYYHKVYHSEAIRTKRPISNWREVN